MPCADSSARVVSRSSTPRDVAVAGPEVVSPAVVVEGQLELLLLAGHSEEVVRRLPFAVSHDVHVAAKLEPELLVEDAALLGSVIRSIVWR
jgi:hypothetical protein